jgi:hypothetical protein
VTGQAQVTGGTFTGVSPFVAPVPEHDFASVRAANDNTAIAGALASDGTLSLSASQSLFIPDGDYALTRLDLAGLSRVSCSGTVRLYVGGTIYIAGDARLNDDGACDLVILSDATSGVSFGGTAKISAAVYAPRANVAFVGTALALAGAVVGRTVSISGTFDFLADDDAFAAARVCEPAEPPDADGDGGGGGGDEGGTTGGSDEEPGDDTELPPIPDLPD